MVSFGIVQHTTHVRGQNVTTNKHSTVVKAQSPHLDGWGRVMSDTQFHCNLLYQTYLNLVLKVSLVALDSTAAQRMICWHYT